MQGAVIVSLVSFFLLQLGESLTEDRFLDDGNFCSPISCAPSNRIECKCRHENYTRLYVQIEEVLDAFFSQLIKDFVNRWGLFVNPSPHEAACSHRSAQSSGLGAENDLLRRDEKKRKRILYSTFAHLPNWLMLFFQCHGARWTERTNKYCETWNLLSVLSEKFFAYVHN